MNLVAQVYRAGQALVSGTPKPVAEAMVQVAGRTVSYVPGSRRKLIARNIERAVGHPLSPVQKQKMLQQAYVSYGRYWAESLRLPHLSPAEVDAGFSFEGMEHLYAALEGPVGPILALPHLGGWEWAGFWLTAVRKREVTVVVEALEPPELFEWFREFREKLGMHVVPLDAGAATAVTEALLKRQIVCLLSDRDISGTGVEVEFFGEQTTLPPGPAMLAIRTGAPVLPVAVYFRGDKCHAVIRPPLTIERRGRLREDVTRITQLLAHELETLIRVAPEQWHLMQPNWPSDYDLLGKGAE